jgi:hypothetical protein
MDANIPTALKNFLLDQKWANMPLHTQTPHEFDQIVSTLLGFVTVAASPGHGHGSPVAQLRKNAGMSIRLETTCLSGAKDGNGNRRNSGRGLKKS